MARVNSAAWSALTLAVATACAEPARPPDEALYQLALSAARTELELSEPIGLHPHPLILASGEWRATRTLDFNTFDSVTVRSIVHADSTRYRVCTLDPTGSCMPEDGAISLVVSNLLQIEPDAVGLIVMVEERRGRASGWRSYSVRIKHSLGRWHVVEFDRTG